MTDDIIRIDGVEYELNQPSSAGKTVGCSYLIEITPKRKQTIFWCEHWRRDSCDEAACPETPHGLCYVVIENGKVVE